MPPPQQQHKRPKNPPRFNSADHVPQIRPRDAPPPSPLGASFPRPSGAPTAPAGASSSPVARSGSTHRKPVPAFDAVAPSMPSGDEFTTLNFGRRISNAADTLSGQQRDPFASGWPASRALTGNGSPSQPIQEHQGDIAHGSRPAPVRSHTRSPSLSLRDATFSPPLQPPVRSVTPHDPTPSRTRAPMDAFASVDMLEGARAHADRTRGQEVFNNGRYEGRASLSNASGEPIRRGPTPTDHMRNARGMAPVLPPIEVDVSSIGAQLRDHDSRRPSAGSRTPSSESESGPAGYSINKHFSFPARSSTHSAQAISVRSEAAPSYSPSSSPAFADIAGFGGEKSHFSMPGESPRFGAAEWANEDLGSSFDIKSGSEKALSAARPSIVALPVYPAPSGSLAKSWKFSAKRVGAKATWVTALFAQAAMGLYLYKRYDSMLHIEAKLPGAFVGGWVFLALESAVALAMCLSTLSSVFTYKGLSSSEPKMRLRGDQNLPAVDIFVVSSGQSDQVTFDCAVAAASIDYPPHRYRVMVIDPSSSVNLQREMIKHAKSQACPHLSYHRRVSSAAGDELSSRAACVNFGLKEASSFGMKGPAEFVAVFEADMIPERNFLRAILPQIIDSPKTAMVKAPHGFFNLPQKLDHATATLMAASETARDFRSGFVCRRAALQEIGGFPGESWVTDGQCEALLAGKGYSTSTVEEVLQWTMARPTYGSQLNAMMIHRLGAVRTAARLNFFLFGVAIKGMTLGQRLCGLGRALNPAFSLMMLILTVGYPFMFSYGGILVLSPDLGDLNLLLQSALIAVSLSRAHDLLWSWSTGLPSPKRSLQAWIFAAPYHAIALLRLILPAWMGGYSRADADMNAVSHVEGAPVGFWKRAGWWVIDPHTGAVFAFLSSVGVSLWRTILAYQTGEVDQHQTALTLLLTILWPSLLWLDFLSAALVPFSQLLLSPSRLLWEKREEFLIRDHYSHVARPRQQAKSAAPFKARKRGEVLQGLTEIGWATACVVVGVATKLFA